MTSLSSGELDFFTAAQCGNALFNGDEGITMRESC